MKKKIEVLKTHENVPPILKPVEMLIELRNMVESGEFEDYVVIMEGPDKRSFLIASEGDDFLNRDLLWLLAETAKTLLEND